MDEKPSDATEKWALRLGETSSVRQNIERCQAEAILAGMQQISI